MGITMGTQWNSVVVTAVSRGALEHLLLPHTPREGVSLHPRDGIGGECLRVLPERVQEALRLRGQHAAAVCEDFLHALLVNSKAMAPRLAVKHRAAVGDPSACAQAELSELYEQSLALGGPAKGEHTLVR